MKTSLYFKDGSSDKEYHTQIVPKGPLYTVEFQYGRRGGTLKSGTKTPQPVSLSEAQDIYDKLVQEKLNKGYSTGQSGALFQSAEFEQSFSGISPHLLITTKEEEIEKLLKDDSWLMQQKYDGERRLVRKNDDKVEGINKKGLIVALPVELTQKISEKQLIIDGEMIGENYYVFDLLELNGKSVKEKPYSWRYQKLKNLSIAHLVVDTFFTESEKKQAFSQIRDSALEGLVFKHRDSQYQYGRAIGDNVQYKFKFWESATLMVKSVNKNKRSVSVVGFDDQQEIALGDVTIPSNKNMPAAGDIVEVRYLYAYKNGSLYQSTYLDQRHDQDKSDCQISQLKYKAEKASLKN